MTSQLPKPVTPQKKGDTEVSGPGLSDGLEINTKCMAMILYYANE